MAAWISFISLTEANGTIWLIFYKCHFTHSMSNGKWISDKESYEAKDFW